MSENTKIIEESDYHELDLSKLEDLNLFVTAVEDAYVEAVEFLPTAEQDKFKKMGVSEEQGREIFRRLDRKFVEVQDLTIDCHDKLSSNEGEIKDESIIKMQDLYNDLVVDRDKIFDAYESDSDSESVEKEVVVDEYSEDETFLPEQKRRKTMAIDRDDGDGSVPIRVAQKAEVIIAEDTKNSDALVNNIINGEVLDSTLKPVIAEVENEDPINEVVVSNNVRIPIVERLSPKGSLTDLYLQTEKYKAFLKSIKVTQAEFDRKVTSEIERIEATGMDNLEKWIGVKHMSTFDYLRDISIAEIEEFVVSPQARKEVISRGLKYETFLIWIDLMAGMSEVVPTKPNMTFGELFAKWVMESVIDYYKK